MILEDGASKHSTGDWPGPSCGMVTCQRTSHEEIDNKRADPASPAGRWRRPYSWFTWIKYQPLLTARTWSSNPTTDLWVQNYHEVQFTDEIHGTESDLDLSGQTLGFQLPNDFCPSFSWANSACDVFGWMEAMGIPREVYNRILPISVFTLKHWYYWLRRSSSKLPTNKQVPKQMQRLYQCNQIQTIYYSYVWIGWRLPLLREMCLVICWCRA